MGASLPPQYLNITKLVNGTVTVFEYWWHHLCFVPRSGFLPQKQVTRQDNHGLTSTERLSLHALQLLLGTGAGSWDSASPKQPSPSQIQPVTMSIGNLFSMLSKEIPITTSLFVSSYFEWLMILLICYSTVVFSNYQCKAMAKYTINLSPRGLAFEGQILSYSFSLFGKWIMREAGKKKPKAAQGLGQATTK